VAVVNGGNPRADDVATTIPIPSGLSPFSMATALSTAIPDLSALFFGGTLGTCGSRRCQDGELPWALRASSPQ